MGIVLDHPFRTFERFPDAVMNAFDAVTGRGHLGNRPASGTAIIEELGPRHLASGEPIVYTSADSVFQIATHVDVVPLPTLYAWCEAARAILTGDNAVARVIARPFAGSPGAFRRLGEARHDYSLVPPERTVLDALVEDGRDVVGIGKIPDIYSHRGFTEEVHTRSNLDGVDRTLAAMRGRPDGLVFTNLVEFDSLYGHRRDPKGYAAALRDVDERLPELLAAVAPGDVLLFVSDHGNDPTWPGTDHTREHGLLLAYAPGRDGGDLGTRASFADVGATVAELLAVPWDGRGTSFAAALRVSS
jgi:phosphopentomutase